MPNLDIRWKQRLQNYQRALLQLETATQLSKIRALSELERQGLIQAFEFTHELAWNLMQDYISYQGATNIKGSRDATREAFRTGLIADGGPWMEMIQSRNHSSHTYNAAVAADIATKITESYTRLFLIFSEKMSELEKLSD